MTEWVSEVCLDISCSTNAQTLNAECRSKIHIPSIDVFKQDGNQHDEYCSFAVVYSILLPHCTILNPCDMNYTNV